MAQNGHMNSFTWPHDCGNRRCRSCLQNYFIIQLLGDFDSLKQSFKLFQILLVGK